MESAVAEAVAQQPIETLSEEALPIVAEPVLATVVPFSADRGKLNNFNTSDTAADRCATRSFTAIDVLAYAVAAGLTTVAALFSVKGMVTLFPGAPILIIAMASMMEASKLVAAGWLARCWHMTVWIWRAVLVALISGLAIINASGVYAQLVAAHVGQRGKTAAVQETQDATIAARIEMAAHNVADIDRRLGQIDPAIDEANRRGRTKAAMATMEGQRKARAALAGERNETAATLANLQTERASVTARGRQIETEAAKSPPVGNGDFVVCMAEPINGRDIYGSARASSGVCTIGAAEAPLLRQANGGNGDGCNCGNTLFERLRRALSFIR
jgi:hypothetical protein